MSKNGFSSLENDHSLFIGAKYLSTVIKYTTDALFELCVKFFGTTFTDWRQTVVFNGAKCTRTNQYTLDRVYGTFRGIVVNLSRNRSEDFVTRTDDATTRRRSLIGKNVNRRDSIVDDCDRFTISESSDYVSYAVIRFH